jgi:uncharacterized protein (TIGR02118 family)
LNSIIGPCGASSEKLSSESLKEERTYTMSANLIVFYKTPPDPEKFDKYYFETHIPLVQKIPGLLKAEVSRFTGEDAPYYLMATLYFDSGEEREAGLSSPAGQTASADVPNFAAPGSFTIAFADTV